MTRGPLTMNGNGAVDDGRLVYYGGGVSRCDSGSATPRSSPAANMPSLPGLPQARTPRPPATPPPRRRPATGGTARPLPGRSPPGSGGRPQDGSRLRPTTAGGRPVRLGSLLHRPESPGAVQSPAPASKSLVGLLPLERGRSRASPALVLLCGARFGASSAGESERPSSAEAWTLIEAGQYHAALARLDAAIELQPTVPVLFANRALANLELGHTDEAVEDCESRISLAPDDADGYLRLSSMCVTVGQRSRAVSGLQRGLQRLPGHEDIERVLKELEKADEGDIGPQETCTVADRAQEETEPISVAFTDLVARGRALLLNLPHNEREDIFRALKMSNSLVARMIRDACAVTVQCAIRVHQVPYQIRSHYEHQAKACPLSFASCIFTYLLQPGTGTPKVARSWPDKQCTSFGCKRGRWTRPCPSPRRCA